MDNPWYFAAGGGVSRTDDLPFGRPPHLKWQGLSRGDLALLNDDPDPYATEVSFQTDKDGFRNSTDVQNAAIVFIGDSYTEAGNIPEEKTFVQLASKQLGVQTRNLGRAGYSASTELGVLEKYAFPVRPKIIVWQIAESNDLAEEVAFREWLNAGRPPFFDFDKRGKTSRADSWRRRSIVYKFWPRHEAHSKKQWPFAGVFVDARSRSYEMRFLPIPAHELVADAHPGWPFLANAVRTGRAWCEKREIRLILLLIPRKYNVMRDFVKLHQSARPFIAGLDRITKTESISAHLEALAEGLGIRFVDSTKRLRNAAAAGEVVYLPFDTHLSEQGHKIITELIVETLHTNALL